VKPETVMGSELKCGDLVRFKGKDVIIVRVEPPFLPSGLVLPCGLLQFGHIFILLTR